MAQRNVPKQIAIPSIQSTFRSNDTFITPINFSIINNKLTYLGSNRGSNEIKDICEELGIKKEELEQKTVEDFREEGVTYEMQQIRYEKHETNRKEKMKFIKRMMQENSSSTDRNSNWTQVGFNKRNLGFRGMSEARATYQGPQKAPSSYATRIQGILY